MRRRSQWGAFGDTEERTHCPARASARRPAHVGWVRCERVSQDLLGIVDEDEGELPAELLSSRSRSFRLGRITERIPVRCAARTFSLIPPTGSTLPRSVISPVMATSLCTGRRMVSEVSAVMIVTPAEAHLGDSPGRHVPVDGLVLEELGIDVGRLGIPPVGVHARPVAIPGRVVRSPPGRRTAAGQGTRLRCPR
jgi:hypothetical protein